MDPDIQQLISWMEQQAKQIEELKAEIARLKKLPAKPNIKPSTLHKPADNQEKEPDKRSDKVSKIPQLHIHEAITIEAKNVPPNSVFKGYKEWMVQDIVIEERNICYRLKTWLTPGGKYITAELPEEVQGTHFGRTLRCFMLYLHHQCHVTQGSLHEALQEFGIAISKGQVSNILTADNEPFWKEKEEMLQAAMQAASYIQADDTGARHQGKNGVCTFIGNEWFSYFKSTGSKSRINFLELLRGEHSDYVMDEYALAYMYSNGMPQMYVSRFAPSDCYTIKNKEAWTAHLDELNIKTDQAVRIATEAALLSSILSHGVNERLAILSDDAGQFNVLAHALCWMHAVRNIEKLGAFDQALSKEVEPVLTSLWKLYQHLKAYQKNPLPEKIQGLELEFDAICQHETQRYGLRKLLDRLALKKKELLFVLKRPEIPLHNNTSERDIREYVKRRKISGSTRSESGRKSRDAFTSLKKTCRKLKISFWTFLNDRLSDAKTIENLSVLITQKLVATRLTYSY